MQQTRRIQALGIAMAAGLALSTVHVMAQSGGTAREGGIVQPRGNQGQSALEVSRDDAKRACPMVRDFAAFHKCALEKMKTFKPRLTPDGKPDMNGLWGATRIAQDIEEIPAGAYGGYANLKALIVDPPSGKFPYQPWAMAQRFKNPDAFLSPTAACLPTPVQRWVYSPVEVTGHRIVQQPNQIVFNMERLHTYRIVPMDGRPPLPSNIRLWRGDTRGRWDGNTLVMTTTNRNDLGWFDHIGTFISAEATMEERMTFLDENTMHYSARFEDPKVFTQPWTMVIALLRLNPKGIDYTDLEDTTVENCDHELIHMINMGQRVFPGLTALAPK